MAATIQDRLQLQREQMIKLRLSPNKSNNFDNNMAQSQVQQTQQYPQSQIFQETQHQQVYEQESQSNELLSSQLSQVREQMQTVQQQNTNYQNELIVKDKQIEQLSQLYEAIKDQKQINLEQTNIMEKHLNKQQQKIDVFVDNKINTYSQYSNSSEQLQNKLQQIAQSNQIMDSVLVQNQLFLNQIIQFIKEKQQEMVQEEYQYQQLLHNQIQASTFQNKMKMKQFIQQFMENQQKQLQNEIIELKIGYDKIIIHRDKQNQDNNKLSLRNINKIAENEQVIKYLFDDTYNYLNNQFTETYSDIKQQFNELQVINYQLSTQLLQYQNDFEKIYSQHKEQLLKLYTKEKHQDQLQIKELQQQVENQQNVINQLHLQLDSTNKNHIEKETELSDQILKLKTENEQNFDTINKQKQIIYKHENDYIALQMDLNNKISKKNDTINELITSNENIYQKFQNKLVLEKTQLSFLDQSYQKLIENQQDQQDTNQISLQELNMKFINQILNQCQEIVQQTQSQLYQQCINAYQQFELVLNQKDAMANMQIQKLKHTLKIIYQEVNSSVQLMSQQMTIDKKLNKNKLKQYSQSIQQLDQKVTNIQENIIKKEKRKFLRQELLKEEKFDKIQQSIEIVRLENENSKYQLQNATQHIIQIDQEVLKNYSEQQEYMDEINAFTNNIKRLK